MDKKDETNDGCCGCFMLFAIVAVVSAFITYMEIITG